jgi:DNA-binding NarL/FixJ family response regulator
VLKGAEPEETMRAIQAVAGGQAFFGTGVADRMFTPTDRRLGARASLTVREAEVAALLAEGSSNSEIARSLNLSLKTVQNHVSQILTKLDARDRTQAVLRLRGLT